MKKLLMVIVVLGLLTGCIEIPDDYSEKRKFNLKQVKLNSFKSTSGSFFVFVGFGGGQINSGQEITYLFYTEIKGYIKLRRIPSNKVIFREDLKEKEKPYATTNFSCLVWKKKNKTSCSMSYKPKWILHIPENSIFQSFDIDLKNIK